MPKRTISSSAAASRDGGGDNDGNNGSADPATADTPPVGHVAKFSRLSTSPVRSQGITGAADADIEAAVPKELNQTPAHPIRCLLPPHPPLAFASIAAFEAHLYGHHTNRCVACGANFPTTHVLNLHFTELHDPVARARRDRGERIFACLVPGCERVCSDRWKRRRHIIDKHAWRPDYDWAVVERGVDGRESALRSAPYSRGDGRMRRSSLTGQVGGRGVKRNAGFQLPGGDVNETKAESGGVHDKTQEGSNRPIETERESGNLDMDEDDDKDDDTASQASIVGPSEAQPRLNSDSNTSRSGTERKDGQSMDQLSVSLSALSFVPPSVARHQRQSRRDASVAKKKQPVSDGSSLVMR